MEIKEMIERLGRVEVDELTPQAAQQIANALERLDQEHRRLTDEARTGGRSAGYKRHSTIARAQRRPGAKPGFAASRGSA